MKAQRKGRQAARDGFSGIEQFETRCFQERELAQAIRSGDTDRVFATEEKKHRSP